MDQGEEARSRRQEQLDHLRIESEAPAGSELDVSERVPFQSRQIAEQRIGRSGRQHLVPWVAEELEQKGPGLARRRRENEVLGRNRIARRGQDGGERLASREEAERMRLVGRRGAAAEE